MRLRAYLAAVALLLLALLCIYELKADPMTTITFDVGKNIHETAKRSGCPKFSTRNIQGLISYAIDSLPTEIPIIYAKDGYTVTAQPVFAFTLYADEDSHKDLAVETAVLQLETDPLTSHVAAKSYVESLVDQFQQGQWKSYIDAYCPAVSGRSSFLNEIEEVKTVMGCPLDPAYRLTPDDWEKMMARAQSYQWTGAGVLATLSISYSIDSRGLTYSMELRFADIAAKNARDEKNRRRELAQGDANGWNSTAEEAAYLVKLKQRIKVLEAAAVKRGDLLVPR